MTYNNDVLETDIQIEIPNADPQTIIGIGVSIGIVCWAKFLGPGGRNILHEKDNLEQGPILKQKQKDEKKPIRTIQIRATRRHSSPNVQPGNPQGIYNVILYEQMDLASSTLISANFLSQAGMPTTRALIGTPTRLRGGLGVEEINFQGSTVDPERTTCLINNRWVGGIECNALYFPGVIFTDKTGTPIRYFGNKMFVPQP